MACRCLADSLAQQLEQGMIRMPRRSQVINLGRSTTEDVKSLIDLPHKKKAGIGGDLCSLKIKGLPANAYLWFGFLPRRGWI
jgi:hypothetical protein